MAGLQQESSITSKQNRGILEKGKQKGDGLKHFLDASKEALLETERAFLTKSLAFLEVPCHLKQETYPLENDKTRKVLICRIGSFKLLEPA